MQRMIIDLERHRRCLLVERDGSDLRPQQDED